MTSVLAYGDEDSKLMWHTISRWVRMTDETAATSSTMRQVQRSFSKLDAQTVSGLHRSNLPLKLSSWGWLVGSNLPREKSAVPVVTISLGPKVDEKISAAAFRVAIVRQRSDGGMEASGWRFESDEAVEEGVSDPTDQSPIEPESGGDGEKGPAHPYAHAQAIIGWVKGNNCLLHPPHPEDDECLGFDESGDDVDAERKVMIERTLVRHPAFPLPVRTLTGLALSVLATLYGAEAVRVIVRGDQKLQAAPDPIFEDLERLGAFS